MIGYAPKMRLGVLAVAMLAAAGPAFADEMAVSKKVTKLETKDKAVTKTKVLVAVPSVNSCFTSPAEIDVDVKAAAGAVSIATTSAGADTVLAKCLEDAFSKMNVKGTFTARVHLVAKPDPRKQDEKTRALLAKLDGTQLMMLQQGSASGSGATGTGRTADDINKVIKSHSGALRACYQMTLEKEPKLAGTFTYEIKIDTTGMVSAVKLKSSTAKSAKLDLCLKTQLKKMTFGKGGPSIVVYPFVFNGA